MGTEEEEEGKRNCRNRLSSAPTVNDFRRSLGASSYFALLSPEMDVPFDSHLIFFFFFFGGGKSKRG
jgi:hypothetical protein